ncbi:hypothetical protein [Candidatus Sulfurimonas baltica]|uniref:Uncharacterized protein n=1 Tax=Candidatus Sulfurimonas baltica TaxID=2740404 RepID=A0A7S7LXB9_9BACT|nr:hypothetical protein [Candidatus Sulfurimonas baltica]QOY53161.1 hypothetical protein HUE88_05640 [Candidatus Sulfurimonas baltica]
MKRLFLTSGLIIGLLLSINGCSTVSAKYYGMKYCSAEPNPNTWIGEVVEVPLSIYWEDELYNGFTDEDAKLMVINYLDGVHLQTMALNTPDGNVKIYSFKDAPQSYIDLVKEGFAVAEETKKQKVLFDEAWLDYKEKKILSQVEFTLISEKWTQVDNKRKSLQIQIEKIKQTLTLVITQTTKEAMPKMNYTVTTKKLHLPEDAKKYIYMDEVKVIDNRTDKTIAYNTRVMQRYSSSLLPDMVGGRGLYPHSMCGDASPERFDEDVFQNIGRSGKLFPGKHKTLFL